MGRGDVRTKKGKIKARSHGNKRPAGAPVLKFTPSVKAVPAKVTADKVAPAKVAPVKTAVAKAPKAAAAKVAATE